MHLHSSIFNTPQRGEILVGATRQAIQRLVLGLLPELRSCEGVLREDLWQQMRTSLPPDCAAIFITPVGWAARRLVKSGQVRLGGLGRRSQSPSKPTVRSRADTSA